MGQAAPARLDRHVLPDAELVQLHLALGDFNVEQHVHYLDVCAWIMKEQPPVKAIGMGGRQVLTGPEYGQIYDHFSVVYEYADGARLISNCRQQPGCKNDMSAQVVGSRGRAQLAERRRGMRIFADQ